MAGKRKFVYRAAFQLPATRIAEMDEHGLNELMLELLRSQANRSGAAVNAVRVNTEVKAKDEGCDGWTPQPTKTDSWLGQVPTCWQFKSGHSGERNKLKGEVLKRIPRETLTSGGRFVVIASGSVAGKSGDDVRRKAIVEEAKEHGIPHDKIEVLGSEALALWCNQHPAVSARWALGVEGLVVSGQWESQPIHTVPWQANEVVQTRMAEFQRDLDFEDGPLLHLHIQGPPGVGKTRFALELCRSAPWRGEVIYVSQAQEFPLNEVINSASKLPDARLMIVADEVQHSQLTTLRDTLDYGNGRIRLITISPSNSPDPSRSPSYEIGPLDGSGMTEVVKGWHPGMPHEHVAFVVRFAGGFVRLAKLAAQTVADNPSSDVREILDLKHVQDFLSKMLGNGDRRALYVLACLNVVGWKDDVQVEGKDIAEHLGLDWFQVRSEVEAFHRDFGIAPRSGRYRYISPRPLANYLAKEAWDVYPDEMKALADILPNEKAREAYYERLSQIASSPQARSFSRDQMAFFLTLDDFLDPQTARRWAVLVNADPNTSVKGFADILSNTSVEKRLQLTGDARRQIVSALVRLGWGKGAFPHASKALALLAEAETETWANNATSEFKNGYKLVLGGTALPYQDRLKVLDELVSLERPQLTRLVLKALAQTGERHASRFGFEPAGTQAPELEWHPQGTDKLDCTLMAVQRLTRIAVEGRQELKDDLLNAAKALVWMIKERPVRGEVIGFLNSIRQAYPETREPLRALVAGVLAFERHDIDRKTNPELEEVEHFLRTLEENTLWGRLQQLVGPGSWGENEPDLAPLALELLSHPDALAEHWTWLTSGEANDAWRLGVALAAVDSDGKLELLLPALAGRGSDHRIIGLYASKRREIKGDVWYDAWFHALYESAPTDMPLLLDLVWRAGATDANLRLLIEVIKKHGIDDHRADALSYGRWHGEVSKEVLDELLHALIEEGKNVAAVAVLHERIKLLPIEIEWWEDRALEIATNASLIRAEKNYSAYHWKEVVEKYLAKHALKVAGALFDARIDLSKGYWSLEYNAREIIEKAIAIDAPGVWSELSSRLENPQVAYKFTPGFPEGIVDTLPHEDIMKWVAVEPSERASLMARLVTLDFRTDETLASKVLGEFGDIEEVGDSFSAAFNSGIWSGTWSGHWNALAADLEYVVQHTSLTKLKSWAHEGASGLRLRAEKDSVRDEEQDLRW